MLPVREDPLTKLLDQAAIEREQVKRHGLGKFIQLAWHVLEPDTELVWGWALDAMVEHLEAVTAGEITRLLINVPPGMAKSLVTSVFWPAWEWGPAEKPHLRIIGTSHSKDFSKRDCRKMRDLVDSEWYLSRWGDQVTLRTRGELGFENHRRGTRKGMPFASLTGGRGDRVIIDDPHTTETAESQADRETAIRIFRESVPTRINDPKRSAIVVIMQRLHEEDISGEILKEDLGYDHLMLPMRYDEKHPYPTTTCIGFEDPREDDGELLFEERFAEDEVKKLEITLGPHAAAGQLQQRPSPRGGGIVKRVWFRHRFVVRGADPIRIIQSWDTASSTNPKAATSACITAAQFSDRLELWHCFTDRLRFADLQNAVKDQSARFSPNIILIENKSSGISLVQQLEEKTTLPIRAWDPGKLDKDTRIVVETPYMAAGHVHLPDDEPWVDPFLHELTTIPASRTRDRGDALSQLLRYVREGIKKLPAGGPRGGSKSSARRPR